MFPTNNERLIGVSDAFSAFVYGYPSSCPCAHCTPNKSVPTLRYTRRPGPIYTGHACRHLPSAVPWISEDRLLRGHSAAHSLSWHHSFRAQAWHLSAAWAGAGVSLAWSQVLSWSWNVERPQFCCLVPGTHTRRHWRASCKWLKKYI